MSGVAVGIDIGGTFTDLVLLDAAGRVRVHKVLSTPDDPSRGALVGLRELCERAAIHASELELIVHSTTLVTNAILERKGVTTALLCTRGFRDTLEMRREQRYDLYDLFLRWPEPLVPRDRRLGVSERMSRDGVTLVPPDADDVRRAADTAVALGARSIAVSLLHSYVDARHERAVADMVRSAYPDIEVTLSAEVAPVIGEYERTSTAVAEAYVAPLAREYLTRMETAVRMMGFAGRFLLMLSSGSAASIATARAHPVRLVESGPAAGAAASALIGRLVGADPVLSFDMGGTTAKVCLVEGGVPTVVNELEVARAHRLRRGSGLPLLVPSVELIEIGAGGGSIATVDETGLLRVGPSSAGADPGPACYGRGGRSATVTDANLLLGYLDASYFLGGEMRLDVDAARAAVAAVAMRLGLSVERTAAAIHASANESMTEAARTHLIERNWDPRKVTLVAFGGAGPAHAAEIARKLGIARVVFPIGAGAASALGSLVAPLSFQNTRSLPGRLSTIDWTRANRALDELADLGRAALRDAGVALADAEIVREADMHIRGQAFEISVPLPSGALSMGSVDAIASSFAAIYRRLYSRYAAHSDLEVVNWKVTARGPRRLLDLGSGAGAGDSAKGAREMHVPALGTSVRAIVHDRYRLAPGARFEGPVLVEERETTIVIPPRARVRVDDHLDLVVELEAA